MTAELALDPAVVLGCGTAQPCADLSCEKEAAVQLPIGPERST